MKVIHKFNAPPLNQRCTHNLSPDYEILSVGLDPSGHICMWIELDPAKIPTIIEFRNYGTGCPLKEDEVRVFLGTVLTGLMVQHIFKINNY